MSLHQRTGELHDRHQRLNAGAAIGAASGFGVGLVVDLIFGGSSVVSLLAMPITAAVIGLTMGVLLSVRSRSPLDDPHRLPAPPPGPVDGVLGGPAQHRPRDHQSDARQLDRQPARRKSATRGRSSPDTSRAQRTAD